MHDHGRVLGVGGSALSERMGGDAEKKPGDQRPASTDKQAPAGKAEARRPRQDAGQVRE